ncbi:MAG: hypothetical protein IMZ46_05665 [Acidobacteria bacterium]|nr:hypothetical protein [Acidobacteriota bacterium]
MNLESRIKKLEVLVAALPEVNKAHVEALARFLESGDVNVLPDEGVSRAETLMVARSIAPADADTFPGLAVIAEAMTSSRLCKDVWLKTPTAAEALAALRRLGPADPPSPVVFCEKFDPSWVRTPGHDLLSGLGLIQLFRIVYEPQPIQPKPDTV